MISAKIKENIKGHLQMLTNKFNYYFPAYNKIEYKFTKKLIRNLYVNCLRSVGVK